MRAGQLLGAALRKRAANGGRHLHHSACIHNLPPAEQVELRGQDGRVVARLGGSTARADHTRAVADRQPEGATK